MNIIINNEIITWNVEQNSLYHLLVSFKLYAEKGIAVAVNNEVVPRKNWQEFQIQESANITVIKASQGG